MPPPKDPHEPLLSRHDEPLELPVHKQGAGPIVGIVIIVVLLAIGALYFWGAHLNTQANRYNNLPFIPGDSTTTAQ